MLTFHLSADRKHSNTVAFRDFRREVFHSSLVQILSSLKPGMSALELAKCADNCFRWILFALALYIADYPEQVLLAGLVSGWCAR